MKFYHPHRGYAMFSKFLRNSGAGRETSKNHSLERPAGADWRLKGDGVAYTTSREIIESEAGRAILDAASHVRITSSNPLEVVSSK